MCEIVAAFKTSIGNNNDFAMDRGTVNHIGSD